jgi:hypothetical protein
MVSEEFIEVPRRGTVRVDMRMRVENRPTHHLLEELAGRPVYGSIHYGLLMRQSGIDRLE